jgi:hypothetical protein
MRQAQKRETKKPSAAAIARELERQNPPQKPDKRKPSAPVGKGSVGTSE